MPRPAKLPPPMSEDEYLDAVRRNAAADAQTAREMQTGSDRDDYDQDKVADLLAESEATVRATTATQVRRMFGHR